MKRGKIREMLRDLDMWLMIRWLRLATIYTKKINSESGEKSKIYHLGLSNTYKKLILFQVEYTSINLPFKLWVILPYFIAKKQLLKFEKDFQYVLDNEELFLRNPKYSDICANIEKAGDFIKWSNPHDEEFLNYIGVSSNGVDFSTYFGLLKFLMEKYSSISKLISALIVLFLGNLFGLLKPIINLINALGQYLLSLIP
jgi:hypothetical protein